MLLFGHLGLTLVFTGVFEKTMVCRGAKKVFERLDYRLVLIGSILPDIIDKPLGGIILKESLGNGRIYAHTLFFLLFLFALSAFFQRKFEQPAFFGLAGGSLAHHVFDGMWFDPETYLWPAYGWGFPKGDPEGWLSHWLESLLTDPWVYVPEIIGGMALLYFFIDLICRRRVNEFIRNGRVR
ncbi:MAG: metal-dependent hydrolase [Peptococcaceae bacterium]|nr:MAG: metal-dependent hydrolase [Peptococcaceae bacterium]